MLFFYVLSVYAKDGGLPPNYAKATVRIKVLDVNDNTPVFGRLYYSIEVPENLEASPLFTLRATDPDAGDSGGISYRISGENWFWRKASFGLVNKSKFFILDEPFIIAPRCSWRSIRRLPLGQRVRRAVHLEASGSGEEGRVHSDRHSSGPRPTSAEQHGHSRGGGSGHQRPQPPVSEQQLHGRHFRRRPHWFASPRGESHRSGPRSQQPGALLSEPWLPEHVHHRPEHGSHYHSSTTRQRENRLLYL